jgi:hypothetical protein
MARAGWCIAEAEQVAGLVSIASLGRSQPDFSTLSSADKKLAIIDLYRPSDVPADQLLTAYTRKETSSALDTDALHYYQCMRLKGGELRSFPW